MRCPSSSYLNVFGLTWVSTVVLLACAGPPPTAPISSGGPVTALAATPLNSEAAGSTETTPPLSPTTPPTPGFEPLPADARVERGRVVWESNRSGSWRIWLRALDNRPAQQLTPEEPSRHHCCPHLSPDGQRVAYLSLPRGRERYPLEGAGGILRVARLDGSEEQTLPGRARTYFEHRAAVWRSNDELIFIDGLGRTRLFRLSSGENLPLLDEERPRHGWLIDTSLRWATTGDPTFSPYDREQLAVAPRPSLGGCEPYFSSDGRWGFWAGGAGGPLLAMELDSRRIITLLRKNDPRLPEDLGYLYFPMLARGNHWLAFAASAGQHDHQTSNYDLFIVETDPDTLTLTSQPRRLTLDKATDRYPDIWVEPLGLGRHRGEAPLTVELETGKSATQEDTWAWQLGDGATARGDAVRYRWETPGTYMIEASRGPSKLRGIVRVLEAQPPRLVSSAVRDNSLVVRFDEPLGLAELSAELASGQRVVAWQTGHLGHELVLLLDGELEQADTLRLQGISDLADPPNLAPPFEIPIAAPRWPSEDRGLLLRWPTRGDQAVVPRLTRQGPVSFTDRGGVLLSGGRAYFDTATVQRTYLGAKSSNEVTVELLLTAADQAFTGSGDATVISFAGSPRSRNLALVQRQDRLWLQLRTPSTGKLSNEPEVELAQLPRSKSVHVLVSYSSGRLQAFVEGRQVLDSGAITGGFYHWQPRPLVLGQAWSGGRIWQGQIDALAIYDRALTGDEAHANARLAHRGMP